MSPSRPRSYSYWRDHILHALPIASVISFFGTMIFLTFVFERWGLSAVQMVTPGDTIVTGIPLFAILVLVGAVPWLVAVVIDLIPFKASTRLRVGLMSILVVLSSPFWWFWGPGPEAVIPWVAIFASGCALHALIQPRRFKSLPERARPVVGLILFLPLLTWGAFMVVDATHMASQNGFMRGATIDGSKEGSCAGRLLWFGEKTIVIRCADDTLGIRVMTPADGLTILPSKRQAQGVEAAVAASLRERNLNAR